MATYPLDDGTQFDQWSVSSSTIVADDARGNPAPSYYVPGAGTPHAWRDAGGPLAYYAADVYVPAGFLGEFLWGIDGTTGNGFTARVDGRPLSGAIGVCGVGVVSGWNIAGNIYGPTTLSIPPDLWHRVEVWVFTPAPPTRATAGQHPAVTPTKVDMAVDGTVIYSGNMGGRLTPLGACVGMKIYGTGCWFDNIVIGEEVAPTPPSGACVRRAWLTLGSSDLVALEDRAAGYFCSELVLASPDVREVKSNRPDMDGIDDRTQFAGGRVVSAKVDALAGAGARVDEVAASFGRYMVPSARPYLHYVLDRDDNPERVVGPLRGVAAGWPIVGDNKREIQLQWIAADPVAYDPASYLATAWAGSAVTVGRQYPLTFDRTYAAGPGGSKVDAVFNVHGDYPAQPVVRVYGPITSAVVTFDTPSDHYVIPFAHGFRIDAGTHVTVDTKAHAAYLGDDPTASVLSSLDWSRLVWPVLPSGNTVTMSVSGENTTGLAQAQATWNEGYLS
jgi:hypothetical protein